MNGKKLKFRRKIGKDENGRVGWGYIRNVWYQMIGMTITVRVPCLISRRRIVKILAHPLWPIGAANLECIIKTICDIYSVTILKLGFYLSICFYFWPLFIREALRKYLFIFTELFSGIDLISLIFYLGFQTNSSLKIKNWYIKWQLDQMRWKITSIYRKKTLPRINKP